MYPTIDHHCGDRYYAYESNSPTATPAVETLIAAGILGKTTSKKQDRSFAYQTYVDRLRIGAELEHR